MRAGMISLFSGDKIVIHPETKYGKGVAQGFFYPEKALLPSVHFGSSVCFFVRRSWTNDDVGNFFADTLAGEGSRMESEHENRILFPAEWSAEAFVGVLRKRASPVGAGQRAVGYTCQKT